MALLFVHGKCQHCYESGHTRPVDIPKRMLFRGLDVYPSPTGWMRGMTAGPSGAASDEAGTARPPARFSVEALEERLDQMCDWLSEHS